MVNGTNELAYKGVTAQKPPNLIQVKKAPTTRDTEHELGTLWFDITNARNNLPLLPPTINDIYVLVSKVRGLATWVSLGSGGVLDTLTGNAGGAITSDASDNINLMGTDPITIAGVLGTHTLTVTVADAGEAQKGVLETSTNAESIAGAVATVAVVPTSLKAKLGAQTAHTLIIGAGDTLALGTVAAGTTGQLLVGATGADCAFASSAAGDFSFTNAAAATPRVLSVVNTDTDPGSYSALGLVTKPAGGDAFISFQISGATQYYSIGVDNSVAGDPWKLTNNVDPSTGDAIISSTSAGVITLFNDLDVTEGGTGVSTLTSHGILMGNGSGDINATAEPTNGQLLIGSTGNFPVLGTLTVGSNLSKTDAAGSITLDVGNAIVLGDAAVITLGNDALTVTSGNITLSGTGGNAAGNLNLLNTTTDGRQGVINLGGVRWFSNYGVAVTGVNSNVFLGPNSGNLTCTATGANVGIGADTLAVITTAGGINASHNIAIGSQTMKVATSARANVGMGHAALYALTTGHNNTCIGYNSLVGITTGLGNTALGYYTGSTYTGAESYNILINSIGVVGESNVARIGQATGAGNYELRKTFIHGIRGVTTDAAGAIAVLVSSTGQLGTISSSIRFKENVHDMASYSEDIYKLRPVTFNYKNDESKRNVSGLIAEEVEKVMPQLVAYQDGELLTVHYHDLPTLLLNELQKLEKRVAELEARLK